MSLADLASRVHYTKGHLSKVEAGFKQPNPVLARLCDAAVGAGGALVALLPQDTSTAESNPPTPVTTDDPSEVSPSTATVPDNLAETQPLLASFEARLEQARQLTRTLSATALTPTLVADTRLVGTLAGRARVPELRKLWLCLAARHAELVSWACQETGNDASALGWITQATEWAAAGESHDLRQYMSVRRADLALAGDDPITASASLNVITRNNPEVPIAAWVRGLAWQRQAQVHALLGESTACWRAIDQAATLLTQDPRGGHLVGAATPPPLAIGLTKGWALLDLGRPAESAQTLAPRLAELPNESVRARARFGVRTALALIAGGDITGAGDLITALREPVTLINSSTIRHDLRLLYHELRRFSQRREIQRIQPVLLQLLRMGGPQTP